jgi:hypothetical protein
MDDDKLERLAVGVIARRRNVYRVEYHYDIISMSI